jgi:hypothetical protein
MTATITMLAAANAPVVTRTTGMILLITTSAGRGGRGVQEPGYLGRLMRQIDGSGWQGKKMLISDGPPTLLTAWPTSATPRRQGQKKTYWRALAVGLEEARRHRTNRILILEDDVELCRNSLMYMERARLPDVLGFVTWFDGHAVPPHSSPGIYPIPARYFFCLQGVTWRCSTAEAVLRSPTAAAWNQPHAGDVLIAKILTGRYYGVHVPNLVQHLGAASVCNPAEKLAGVRVANNYPGVQFNAMTLGRQHPSRIVAAR